jgi:hypothetical protein
MIRLNRELQSAQVSCEELRGISHTRKLVHWTLVSPVVVCTSSRDAPRSTRRIIVVRARLDTRESVLRYVLVRGLCLALALQIC